MTKSDLIENLALQRDMPMKRAEQVINEIFAAMQQSLLNDERIEVRGFGSFEIREYEGYKGRNPKTGETIDVKPKKLPFFKVGKELRERVLGSHA
ncbi:MAG: integration host factor subunit beta [Trichlorobacter sp.]|uniref:HU family DNA-binding protein n=1 Tax=Trichlorobacter sp. TaxID=2911007 RepID=UPI00256E8BC1|nr:integration host factor subunit beta [Trichlorobacter sp.]